MRSIGLITRLSTRQKQLNGELNSLLFTGDPTSLQKVQALIASFDNETPKPSEKTFIQYHPQYATREKSESYLKEITANLSKKGGSESLIEVLRSHKWIPDLPILHVLRLAR